jgi:gas vesicle protein
MGYVRGVMHGILLGGVAALLYAPKRGKELRQELSARLDQMRGQVKPVLDQAQEVVQSARPQVERMVQSARPQVERTVSRAQQKITRRGAEPVGQSYGAPADSGTGGTPSA